MISNIVIFIACSNLTLVGHKRRFGNWVYSLLEMIVVILQAVIVITTVIIAVNSHQSSWFSKSRVLLPMHVLSTILLQAPSLSTALLILNSGALKPSPGLYRIAVPLYLPLPFSVYSLVRFVRLFV